MGREASSLLLTFDTLKQVLPPLSEVVHICSMNPECPDVHTVPGKLNVSTNVCILAKGGATEFDGAGAGACSNYTSVMHGLVDATPVLLSADYSISIDTSKQYISLFTGT